MTLVLKHDLQKLQTTNLQTTWECRIADTVGDPQLSKSVVSSLIYLCMSSFVYFAVEGRYFTAATFIYDVV